MMPIARFQYAEDARLLTMSLTIHCEQGIRVRFSPIKGSNDNYEYEVKVEALTSDDTLNLNELRLFCKGFFSHDIKGKYKLLLKEPS